jgi:hypothetical protein
MILPYQSVIAQEGLHIYLFLNMTKEVGTFVEMKLKINHQGFYTNLSTGLTLLGKVLSRRFKFIDVEIFNDPLLKKKEACSRKIVFQ